MIAGTGGNGSMDGGPLGWPGFWIPSLSGPGPFLQFHHLGRLGGMRHLQEEMMKRFDANANAHDRDGNSNEHVAFRRENPRVDQGDP